MRPLTVFTALMTLAAAVSADPRLDAVFPLGGAPGTVLQLKLMGSELDGASVAWFGPDTQSYVLEKADNPNPASGAPRMTRSSAGLEAAVDPAESGSTVDVRLVIDPTARIGHHSIALLTTRGLSNTIPFRVNTEPVVMEAATAHATPPTAQPVGAPVVVNARIETEGELDYYAFEAEAGREYLFEAAAGFGLDPVLSLHDLGGSWFDPGRPVALISSDDPGRFTYRFEAAGRYLVSVKSFLGVYQPHFAYQLRIVTSDAAGEKGPDLVSPKIVQDGRFGRGIGPERLKHLMARTSAAAIPAPKTVAAAVGESSAGTPPEPNAAAPGAETTGALEVIGETEPNDAPDQAVAMKYPGIAEGAIERPGDADHFKFSLAGPARVAIEIQTLDAQPYRFTPWVAVHDASGEEVAHNLFKRVGGDGDDWVVIAEPKTLFGFDQGGEYTVRVRDITSRAGGADFKYRLLLRPQIPHVGGVQVQINSAGAGASSPSSLSVVNTSPGQARTLTVVSSHEEGYTGNVAITVENLPEGIQALPTTQVEPEAGEPFEMINKDWYVPGSQKASILLLASADAPATLTPHYARVHVRPVVQGKPGESIHVMDFPIMVVR